MKHGRCEAFPSFTGGTSGENVTEVIPSTDDPYLIETENINTAFHFVTLFGAR